MGQTHEKRGREQRKKLRRTEKADRKKVRRAKELETPVVEIVDASYFMPTEFEEDRKQG